MSKHSMRTGSVSSPSARWRPSSDSTRCWRRRSALSFSCSSASRALRSARSRMRRLPPRSEARISTAPPRRSARISSRIGDLRAGGEAGLHDDQRRDRERARVVLEDELLGDDGGRLLGLVLEVERLAVAQHAVADLEDLGVGLACPRRRRRPRRRCRRPRWRPAGAPAARARPAAGCARARRSRSPARPSGSACCARGRARSACSGRRGRRPRRRRRGGTPPWRRSRRRAPRSA